MSKFSAEEIVEAVETYGSELQGNPTAIAAVLRAIADRLPGPDENGDIPQYHLYEDSPYGRVMADAVVSSYLAWQWIRDELLRLENKLKHTMELDI
jgi:hypothetical protein